MKKLLSAAITTVIAAAAMMMFASCDNNSNVDVPFDGEVRITSGIATRASGTTWGGGDAIGVYMNLYQGDLGALGANIEYTTASGDGNFESTSPLYFPTEDNTPVDFLAYYPYVTDGSFDPTAYGVDVSNQDDLTLIDLMTASATNVSRSSDAVSLEFYHKLSNIVINITPGSGLSESDLAGLTVTLSGTDTKAKYNLVSNQITLDGEVADITLNTAADGLSAEGIVIPQTLSGVKLSFTTTSYGTFEASISNTPEFEVANQYVYNVTVNTSGITMSSPAAIGDYYYSDGTWSTALDNSKTAIGVVFSVGTDGTSGKVVSLDEEERLAWSTEEVITGATSTSDGLANMAVITAISDWSTNYPAFAWVDVKNTTGTIYESGAKGVWYLPAYQELQELYAGMSGLQWVASAAGDGEIEDWETFAVMPDYGSYADARTVFNALITSAGGTAISTSKWYWSSSEFGSSEAWLVYFVNGNTFLNFKSVIIISTRAILAF